MNSYPIILSIDTSCDETSVAMTQGMRVISNVIASQIEIHRKYGGVMPLEAKLAHHEQINPTYREALVRARIKPEQIDAVAVTVGPGLAIALEVGMEFAKSLSQELNKPLVAVNHMAGHLYSSLAVNSKGITEPRELSTINDQAFDLSSSRRLSNQPPTAYRKNSFPVLALLISGGHTEIIGLNFNQPTQVCLPSDSLSSKTYPLKPIKLGFTVDDAAGECLDKFARMLDLGYPGAAAMEQIAKTGNAKRFQLPLPMTQSHDLNYSFSGLKTAGRHLIEQIQNSKGKVQKTEVSSQLSSYQSPVSTQPDKSYQLKAQDIADLAASFQAAVFRAVLYKLEKAIQQFHPVEIWLGGGVVANSELRRQLRVLCKKYQLRLKVPYTIRLMGDNAAMIGMAAFFQYSQKDFVQNLGALHRQPRLSL